MALASAKAGDDGVFVDLSLGASPLEARHSVRWLGDLPRWFVSSAVTVEVEAASSSFWLYVGAAAPGNDAVAAL